MSNFSKNLKSFYTIIILLKYSQKFDIGVHYRLKTNKGNNPNKCKVKESELKTLLNLIQFYNNLVHMSL